MPPDKIDHANAKRPAIQCFWSRGYEATSIKDLIGKTGLTAASLYNAFGDKRSLFRSALNHYAEESIGERLQRYEALSPRKAIEVFFDEILRHSLRDREHKGCMVVNSALEIAPHDPELRKIIVGILDRIEAFFLNCVLAGQAMVRLPALTVSVARPSWVAVIRVIGVTESRFFMVWPFITIGAKSALVSLSIVQTSKRIQAGAVNAKVKDRPLVEADIAVVGASRAALVEALVDPNEPFLPPKRMEKYVENLKKALELGTPATRKSSAR